jgi:hypothetical protein
MDQITSNLENLAPAPHRSDNNEIQLRTSQVYEWIMWGWPRHKMVTEGEIKWKVSSRAIDDYIGKAKELIKDQVLNPQREELLKESIASWNEFKERCKNSGDRKNEAVAKKQIDRILGLDIQKIDVTSKGESLVPKIFVQTEDLKKDIENNL